MSTLGGSGLGKYRMDPRGIAQLARTAAIQNVAVEAARRIANTATRVDRSSRASYPVRPAVVPAGRRNEMRGGAVVTDANGTGGPDRALLTAIDVETEYTP